MAKVIMYIRRLITIAIIAAFSWALAFILGPWLGLAAWAALIGAACAASAWFLKGSRMGQLTWRNRLAGIFLPWGYRLGGGKLLPITLIAWSVWVLLGAAMILLTAQMPRHYTATLLASATSPASTTISPALHPLLAILLLASWILYGGLILRQLGYIFHQFRNNPRGRRTMLLATAAMLALIAASATLWLAGHPAAALLVAGGPILLIGGGYGLFLAVFLLFGRNARWN